MRNAQALRACPVRDGARPAFPGHLTSALGWPQGLPRTTHRRGRAGAAPERRQGLLCCRQVAARAPPPPLQRRGRGTCPRPWRSQDGDQRSARGAGLGGLAGTCRSSTPSEVLPVGGGGANPQTHDLQARPSEEARRSCGHVTPRPAPTTAGRTGVTARRLRPPPSRPGLGTPDSCPATGRPKCLPRSLRPARPVPISSLRPLLPPGCPAVSGASSPGRCPAQLHSHSACGHL